MQGYLRSKMSDGFHNPVQARLRRDLKAQRQLGLPKHSPAALSVLILPIRGLKKSSHHAFPLQLGVFEIDQQTQIEACDSQVTDHLGYVGFVKCRYHFGV